MKIVISALQIGLDAMPLMATSSEVPPQPGEFAGTFDATGAVCFQLPPSGSHYISATLIGVTDAYLIDAQKQHLRALVKEGPADGEHVLLFALPQREASALVLNGRKGTNWKIFWHIETAYPLQHARERAPESPRLQHLAKTLTAGGATEAFWQEIAQGGTPLIEPFDASHKRVTFLWRGTHSNVFMVGSPQGDHEPLFRMACSDVWFRSYIIPANTRMQYQLAPDVPKVDGSPWEQRRAILISAQADPRNPRILNISAPDRWNQFSLLDLNPTSYFSEQTMAQPVHHGTLTRHQIYSDKLGNSREIMLYRPRAMLEAQWTLMLFDGQWWQKEYHTANVLDGLIACHKLPPINIVFIDSLELLRRSKELPPNNDFADFMADELSPWLHQQGIPLTCAKTVLAGASYGGLAASWVALRYPHQFGNVLSMSGSYWWAPEGEEAGWLTRQYQQSPRYPLRFWIQAGSFENAGPNGGIYPNVMVFEQMLRDKGYHVSFHTSSSGHGFAAWVEALVHGMQAFTGVQ